MHQVDLGGAGEVLDSRVFVEFNADAAKAGIQIDAVGFDSAISRHGINLLGKTFCKANATFVLDGYYRPGGFRDTVPSMKPMAALER
tara:strand:+ start:351 stop:611 length:261 start_codon:yes stop_codon:yes gene_type:complete